MTKDLKAAEGNVEAAKARLGGTFEALKSGLLPSSLAAIAKDAAKGQAVRLALGSITAARKRPVAVAAIAAAAMLITFRKPLAALFKRRKTMEKIDERPE